MFDAAAASSFPRLTYLRIKNYRALRDVQLRDLTPLTVFIGPNVSGKSTILDALAFLAEAVSGNLQQAWEGRNRFAGMRTRGSDGPIEFEVECFISKEVPRLRYHLSIDEADGLAFVSYGSLTEPNAEFERLIELVDAEPNPLRDQGYRDVFRINIYERDGNLGRYYTNPSSHPIVFATGAFPEQRGELAPKTLALVRALMSYRHIGFKGDGKGISDAGPREKISADGSNLPNVLYYLQQNHPQILAKVIKGLRRRIPVFESVIVEVTSDERLLLRFKEVAFEKPFPMQVMSGGTKRMTMLLTLLNEPLAKDIIGLEEPENELHPLLLTGVAEAIIESTENRQLLVATHSPFLLDALEPAQVWILYRGEDGYTQAKRTADIPQVKELVEDGSPLGYLWTSKFFRLGDPLTPRTPAAQ